MSWEAPERLALPSSWVHVDLQKLRTRLEAHAITERVNELKIFQGTVAHQVNHLTSSSLKRQRRVEYLTKELQELTAQLEEDRTLLERGRRVVDGTRNQIYYQKGLSRTYLVPSSSLASAETPQPSPCPLSLYGFSLLATCVGSAPLPTSNSVGAFLKSCAPLFQWSEEERAVKPPFFFDEPCLMEGSAAGASSAPSPTTAASGDSSVQLRCRSSGCAYWHADQLAHVKLAARFCATSLCEGCASDERVCYVRRVIASLSRRVSEAESVSVVCAMVCEVLQSLIGLGLHLHLGKGKDHVHALAAPVVGLDAAGGVSHMELIQNTEEKERWCELVQEQLRHTAHASANAVSPSVATEVFQRHRDALSWRCLLACVPDVVQRQWLAQQGVQLFPSCPQLHVEYVLACVEREADVSVVAEACVSSCRTLSSQAAASVVGGLDGGQYGTVVARHIGYMVAVVFVHCSKTDAAAALRFLTPLLSSDADAELAALLLPVARQNLTLMSVALRRMGHLRGVEHLPLAAVSEQALELASSDGVNPADSGRDSLYASLKLVNAFKRDHFEAHLTAMCAGALELSLLRTFSHRLSYMERVAEKTVPASALAQGALYGDYVTAVAQQHSVAAAVQAAEVLAAADGATCFLNVLLSSRLRVWGFASPLSASRAVAQLCDTEKLPADTFDSAERLLEAATSHTEASAVEWVAAYALHLRSTGEAAHNEENEETERERAEREWAALLKFPLEVLAADTVAAGLYFTLLLRLSAVGENSEMFYASVHRCLSFFREVHLRTWSPLDASYASMVGLPHHLSLSIYEVVPLLLGAAAQHTHEWRCLVLAAAMELGVLHPLLKADASAA